MLPQVILTVALVVLVARCGAGPASSLPRYDAGPTPPPETAAPYVAQFQREWGHAVRVPVRVVPPGDFDQLGVGQGTVGLCTEWLHGPQVLLNSDWWFAAGDVGRWVLTYHELGHCVLGREHNDALLADGCPESLMYWSVTPVVTCIVSGRRTALEYATELFSDASK